MPRTALCLGLAVSIAACAIEVPPDREITVQAPLAKASVVWKDSLFVRLAPGVSMERVVPAGLPPLWAGMKLEEAVQALGEPVGKRSDPRGTYFLFKTTPFNVELAHLQYRDSGPVDKWVVVAAPSDNRVAAVLSAELAQLVARAGVVEEITVHERGTARRQAFSARVKEGRLLYMQWYSLAGFPSE